MTIAIPEQLRNGKNLLGFSGGVDSSALFHKLVEEGIDFDIAIVNYLLRDQAQEEVKYAYELAEKYGKKCFVKIVNINGYSDMENVARNIRYTFFQSLVNEHGYTNVIFAHQLNDRMEWLLMKMAQGAGLATLSGFELINNDRDFTIVRPLINTSREEIEYYLNSNNLKYFVDHTNLENTQTRNKFRNTFVNDYVKEYSKGIRESFSILEKEKKELYGKNDTVREIANNGYVFEITNLSDSQIMYRIDKVLKTRFQYLLSKAQRKELFNHAYFFDIANTIVIEKMVKNDKTFIFIFEKKNVKLDKESKEKYRILRIPKNLRKFVTFHSFDIQEFYNKI